MGRSSGALCSLLAALILVIAAVPARAGRMHPRQTLTLVEYSDPAFARRGTLTELIYTGNPAPPYGYAYAVRMKVKGICRRSKVSLAGGRVKGWVQDYDYGDPGTFSEDLYADAVAIIPYGADRGDGSFGRDVPCGGGKQVRHGTLRVYRRGSDYWFVDNGFFHVVDVLDCSDELGCQWYAGYARRIPKGGIGPDRTP
jgi:hypothetical protein